MLLFTETVMHPYYTFYIQVESKHYPGIAGAMPYQLSYRVPRVLG